MEAKERHHNTVMVMRQKQTSLTLNTVTEPLRSIAQPILSSSCQKWASIAARNTLTQTGVTVVVFPRKDCSMSTIRQGTTNWNASALTSKKIGQAKLQVVYRMSKLKLRKQQNRPTTLQLKAWMALLCL